MTRYLLDANIFIEAKNRHYGFDFCPAFWEWLIAQNNAGTVASINKVYEELKKGKDDLSAWTGQRGDGFFMPADEAVAAVLNPVAIWANSQRYENGAISTFLKSADYFLVAHAHAHDFTVVTHERQSQSIKKIKIPDACIGLNVSYLNPYEMLRKERARFVLGGG